jgi:hypothetical protein
MPLQCLYLQPNIQQPAQTAANRLVQLSEAAGPSTQPAAHSMMLPAQPLTASTRPVVPQSVPQPSAGRQAIIKRRGPYYEPIHGWDGDLPRYSLECRAIAGYPCLAGPSHSYLEHIESRYPQFTVMYQRVERGYMVIWPEAINRKVATDLHGDDELWKQFIELYLLLQSWSQSVPSVRIDRFFPQITRMDVTSNLSVIPRPSLPESPPTGPPAAPRSGHYPRKGPGPRNTPKRMAEERQHRGRM